MVRVAERAIIRSLEGSHEDGLQNVFNGEVTNVAHGAVEFGDRCVFFVFVVFPPASHVEGSSLTTSLRYQDLRFL